MEDSTSGVFVATWQAAAPSVGLKIAWPSESALTLRSQTWNSPGGRADPHHALLRAATSTTSHLHADSRDFRREQLRNGYASLTAITATSKLDSGRKNSIML